jgi:hypothetical protein
MATAEKVINALSVPVLKVSADRLSVMLTVLPELAGREDAVEAVRADMERLKVTAPLNVDLLSTSLQEVAASGSPVVDLIISSGTPPTPPIDARLEWAKEFFASGYYIDPETKYIDYHRKAATPSVDKDEIIATEHPAEPGKDGHDVFGATILPAKPKPRESRAGANVTFDESTGIFKALCNGRVKLDGKVITVIDVYQVSGGVGTASGNIDHKGSVVINGGIDSEFKVCATGDIEVREGIGAADIDCGGNLIAHKGISSTPGKKVNVKGNLHAKYLEHATVVCDGDIVVESEILDSSIRATGRVVCAGHVRGGDIMAAAGIEVGEAGAHTESRTSLIAGIDYHVVNTLREATEESKVLKESIPKLEREVKKLEGLGTRINHSQREVLTEFGFKLFEARSRYEELTELRKKLALQMQSHRDATIIIQKQVNPGTMLRVVDSHLEVRDALLGPIVAGLDPVTKELTLSSHDTPTKE